MFYQTNDKRFFLSSNGIVAIREGQEIIECKLTQEELIGLKVMLDNAFEHHAEFVATVS